VLFVTVNVDEINSNSYVLLKIFSPLTIKKLLLILIISFFSKYNFSYDVIICVILDICGIFDVLTYILELGSFDKFNIDEFDLVFNCICIRLILFLTNKGRSNDINNDNVETPRDGSD
jgi:hypothetical protein